MITISPRIHDGRGTARRLCRASAAPRGWARLWISRTENSLVGLAFVLLLLVPFALYAAYSWSVGVPHRNETTTGGWGLLIAAALVAMFLFGRWLFTRLAVQELLEAGLCPACAYRIGDLPAAEDGCRVCPECGAAWRLS